MKRFLYIIIFLIFLILNCTVNDSTGVIKVENRTYVNLTNVKIGDALITSYLAGSNDYYCWYFTTLNGQLTAEGIDITPAQDGEEFEIETGNWVYITAARYPTGQDDSEAYLSLSIEKQGP